MVIQIQAKYLKHFDSENAFGIDLGSQKSVICAGLNSYLSNAVISKENKNFLSCALNLDHCRSTQTRILLDGTERSVGAQVEGRKDALYGFKSLLGCFRRNNALIGDNKNQFEHSSYTAKYGREGKSNFSSEQIAAMYLRKILYGIKFPGDIPPEFANAPQESDMSIQFDKPPSIVLSVPTFWKQSQREALLTAAKVAEIDVLSLVHDTTAAAVCFACTRLPPNAGLRTPYQLIIADFGSQGLQISIFRIAKTLHGLTITALAHSWSCNVGGDNIDHIVAAYLTQKLSLQYKQQSHRFVPDQNQNQDNNNNNTKQLNDEVQKSQIRLIKAAERVKRTLSGVPAINESFELLPDFDVQLQMTREELEKLINGIDLEIKNTVESALMQALDKNSIELVGAQSRMPFLQRSLEIAINDQLSKLSIQQSPESAHPKLILSHQLNTDESVSWGCAKLAQLQAKTVSANQTRIYNSTIPLPADRARADAELNAILSMTAKDQV
ncbi:MAG: putative Hsp70 chaperone Hsp88 [Streblomastix strix]|uniref:Putative Hsp70 chaperone Hsp88 n=1 Tax=Streblomastix strix TaxID=222440 RepID=A0A5J4W8C6_9EUKA|nr:MAG: putative Hsp70 chaperone Hsp88 [Streblomastix strix]